MTDEPLEVLTIGHSTLSYQEFVQLLLNQGVTAVADVRSAPYSRYLPHFNKSDLATGLRAHGISYVFLGMELGGRPSDRTLYRDGRADYEGMAKTEAFTRGLDRVIDGASKFRIALMCSEKSPLECHRCLLVGRALAGRGLRVRHILGDGATETQDEIEDHLLKQASRRTKDTHTNDMFMSSEESLAEAYRMQARKVAFAETDQPKGTDDPIDTEGLP